jgi:hypothetical protein
MIQPASALPATPSENAAEALDATIVSRLGNFRDDRVISITSHRAKPEQTATKCRVLPRRMHKYP